MNDEQSLEIDLVQIIKYTWTYKLYVFLITLVVSVLFAASSFLFTPIYQAKVVLAPVSSDMAQSNSGSLAGQIGGLSSLVGLGGANVADEHTVHLAIFESRKFMREFIQENDLITVLYADDWNAESKTWSGKPPTIWKAVNYFDRKIMTVSKDNETGLVSLFIEWEDAEVAVAWAEKIVLRINNELHSEFVRETEQNLIYLNDQLEVTQNSEMREVLFAIIQEQIQKQMLSSSNEYFAYKIVDPAEVADKPVKPNRILFAILGGMLGGILSVAYAWRKGNKSSRDQIE